MVSRIFTTIPGNNNYLSFPGGTLEQKKKQKNIKIYLYAILLIREFEILINSIISLVYRLPGLVSNGVGVLRPLQYV